MGTKTKDQKPNAYDLMARMGGAFYRARRRIPKLLEDAFQKGTLSARHVSVLNNIVASDPMSVSELSKRLQLSLSATSKLVSELSEAEFVERREDPLDRRRTVISMSTTHGRELAAYVHFRAKPLLRTLEQLSIEERTIFVKGIGLLLHAMEKEL